MNQPVLSSLIRYVADLLRPDYEQSGKSFKHCNGASFGARIAHIRLSPRSNSIGLIGSHTETTAGI